MAKYEALLVAPDGDFVTDFKENSIEKVQEDLADIGSKWVFYPYIFIIKLPKDPSKNVTKGGLFRDKYTGASTVGSVNGAFIVKGVSRSKIVDVVSPESLEFMKGWTVAKAIKKIVIENKQFEGYFGEHKILWGFYE